MNKPVNEMSLDELLYAQRDLSEVIRAQDAMPRAPKLSQYLDDLHAVSAELLKRKNPPKTMEETKDLREMLDALRTIRAACRAMLDGHNRLASALDVYGDVLTRAVRVDLEDDALRLQDGCRGAVTLSETIQRIDGEMAAILDRLN